MKRVNVSCRPGGQGTPIPSRSCQTLLIAKPYKATLLTPPPLHPLPCDVSTGGRAGPDGDSLGRRQNNRCE
eukprot:18114-Pyramimonas_sp.AAC.1